MSNKWVLALQIASVYIGTVIGAGFATGKEIVEFFSKYGAGGIVGIICSAVLFVWLGTKMMLIGRRINASSYLQLNQFLFGTLSAYVVNGLMFMMLIGITSVMLSGAGAIFEEQLSLSKQFGIFLTIVLSIAVISFGVKGLSSVNLLVVPLFILFSLIISIEAIIRGDFIDFSLDGVFQPVKSSFLYVSFNLSLAQAVLVPLANAIKDESAIKLGGVVGGLGLSFILFSSYFSLLHLPDAGLFEIPMAEIVKQLFSGFYYIYILVIFGEIFSSLIGNLYGLERQLSSEKPLAKIAGVIFILLLCYLVSLIGYGKLISTLYPLFGYMSIAFFILLMFKKIPDDNKS
ncbi:hypothetical protein Q4O60_06585 [Aeribacillus pallidus]|nr:hypothetical protein [Aeribacillus pallidus]